MSKHWRPDEEIGRIRAVGDWTRLHGYWRPTRRQPLSDGAKAGLVLVAAACLGAAIGIYQAFGPLEVIAPGAESRWSAGPAGTIVPDVQSEAVHAGREGTAGELRPAAGADTGAVGQKSPPRGNAPLNGR